MSLRFWGLSLYDLMKKETKRERKIKKRLEKYVDSPLRSSLTSHRPSPNLNCVQPAEYRNLITLGLAFRGRLKKNGGRKREGRKEKSGRAVSFYKPWRSRRK